MKYIFGGCFAFAAISIMLLVSKIIDFVICDFIYGWLACATYLYGVKQHDEIFSEIDKNID